MLVFVTGVAGTGKTTLCAELCRRGLTAHDTDDGMSRHVSIADGVVVTTPPRAAQTPEWTARHEFRFDMDRVSELAAAGGTAFLLGSAYGDDEVITIADRSWFLHLEEPELRRRLAGRPPAEYGHAPHELESILAWQAGAAQRYEALGACRLDAARPVAEIADELLGADGHRNSPGGPLLP